MSRLIDWDEITRRGLTWDNRGEFPSLDGPEVGAELERLGRRLDEVEARTRELGLATSKDEQCALALELARLEDELSGPIEGLVHLAYIEIAVDSTHAAAQDLAGKAERLQARLKHGSAALDRWLGRADEATVRSWIADDDSGYLAGSLPWRRALVEEASPEESDTIERLTPHGPLAWERLYKNLVGSLDVKLTPEGSERQLSRGEVQTWSQGSDRTQREAVWRARIEAWRPHRSTAAVALNGLVGWWIETRNRRYPAAGREPLHIPLLQSRMKLATWESLRRTNRRARPLVHRAARLFARGLGVERLAPWDLYAPPPDWAAVPRSIPLGEGLSRMEEAFGTAMPSMGAFVREAVSGGWIDAGSGPHRRPGGLVTGLWRCREPRIFINWTGSPVGMRVAAHEMGHGFHFSRCIQSFRRFEDYSWALLEVPSNFAELILGQHLSRTAPTPEARFAHLWQEVLFGMQMLSTSPFGLELSLQIESHRAQGWLTPDQLDALATEAWEKWFEGSVQPASPARWLIDHHLYLAGTRHTGFLYQFAWFAAMALLKLQQSMGASPFEKRYVAFLENMHRGGVEDRMREHFDVDLAQPEFWEGALNLMGERLTTLEHFLDERDLAGDP